MSSLRVGVLAYPGCFASEVFGVLDLLTMGGHVAAARGTPAPFAVTVVSPRRRVVASGAVALGVAPLRDADVLVVPGFELLPGLDVAELLAGLRPELAAIRSHAARGVALVSVCVGAFLLAEAGVLADRAATTSWLFAAQFAERYPGTRLTPDRLVVSDRGVTTTAAFSAMYDFVLDLLAQYCGPEVARRTARIALVDDARASQAPYVDADLLPAAGSAFSRRVQRRLDQHLAQPYDLVRLAAAFHVSTRTLLRRYKAETGETPLAYLQRARMKRARHLLESTDRSGNQICADVGYADPGTFAELFARHFGVRPGAYRTAFRRRAD